MFRKSNLLAAAVLAIPSVALVVAAQIPFGAPPACAPDDGGLRLPEGYCAVVVAADLAAPRQIALGQRGTLYAAIANTGADAGVVVLRDYNGDGKADERGGWGPAGANDVKLREGYLYLASKDRILRWKLAPDGMKPVGEAETIVSGLPADRSHAWKSIVFGAGDTMFVNVGSPSNSCQQQDRTPRSPGVEPCAELEARAGIWVYSATRLDQTPRDGVRYATGLRNAMAIGIEPSSRRLFAAIHGRDQLSASWGFSDEYNAENPGEEFGPVERNDDYGWPYCYYSHEVSAKVLAPEYGGDGKKIDRCARAKAPAVAYPGHWAPMALAFTGGAPVGADFGEGVFIAFHGSWNRAPLPQAGFRVVFQPLQDGRPNGNYSTFAIGQENESAVRPAGVAVDREGAVFISADRNGMVWKVVKK